MNATFSSAAPELGCLFAEYGTNLHNTAVNIRSKTTVESSRTSPRTAIELRVFIFTVNSVVQRVLAGGEVRSRFIGYVM